MRKIFAILFVIIEISVITIAQSNRNGTAATSGDEATCNLDSCVNGDCSNGTCVCHDGWQGSACQYCGGKVRLTDLSGSIHDGNGNYLVDAKCSWLIDTGKNSSIRMHIEEFATECGWDHLYIYDGDSVNAPLLGVFSGLMYKDGYQIRRVPEVFARSGSALLYFYSDVAYNMSGFNITYEVNACPSRYSDIHCSGHGVCIESVCTCDVGWTGEACDVQMCPNQCSYNIGQGECNQEKHRCDCYHGFKGADCSQRSDRGSWEAVTYKDSSPEGSASHCSIVWRDSLYIVGGESYHKGKMIYVYDFNNNVWETPHIEGRLPLPRYAHSCVLFDDKIYMYGGVIQNSTITNELWTFDISAKVWKNVTVLDNCVNKIVCGPLKVAGHTANLVQTFHGNNKKMVVIFGHSPQYGYLNTVQEYHFGTREWQIVETTGYPVKGGYGHSSSYDPLTNLIYVYGGYISESLSTQVLTNILYSYHPNTREWRLLTSAPSARFFHTGLFVSGGLMLVFGGNTHNDTVQSHGAKCYSSDIIVYDVICDSWHQYPMPRELVDLPRYGHSATIFEKSMFIYGGFNGQILYDMLKFTPGDCEHFTIQNQCLESRNGIKCVWDNRDGRCIQISKIPKHMVQNDDIHDATHMRCIAETQPREMSSYKELCEMQTDCAACVQTSYSCVWCGENCSHKTCRDNGNSSILEPIARLEKCNSHSEAECLQLHTCPACSNKVHCAWSYDRCKPQAKSNNDNNNINNNNTTVQAHAQPLAIDACPSPCSELTSCKNCTEFECIWCQSEGKCIDKNAYPVSFPYGKCREWTTSKTRCRATETGREWCSFYSTCVSCRSDPACGWCDDGSGTGKGQCLEGGAKTPTLKGSNSCASENWFFTECPTCQCNGHSTCFPNSSECIQPCGNSTIGPHCDKCIAGYYGSPLNGGTCQPCTCNDQGTQCTSDTGKCFCSTKGITGDHCEKCDVNGRYYGDPTNKGSCFYNLTIDYQFTFNLSKKEDRHYTGINFKNSPPKPNVDTEFSITCSVLAKMNITIQEGNSPEKPFLSEANCTTYKHRLSKVDYNFGSEDKNNLTTFYVYVYDFRPPLWIQISFAQYSKLHL